MALGNENFATIKLAAGRIIQDTSPTRDVSLGDACNRRLNEASSAYEWPQLIRVDETGLRNRAETDLKTFELGQAEAPMPVGCGRVKSIVLQTLGCDEVVELEQEELYQMAGGQLNATGTPRYFCHIGQTAQYRRLVTSDTVTLTSNNALNDSMSVRMWFKKSTAIVETDAFQDVTGSFSTGVLVDQECAEGYPIERISLPVGWHGSLNVAGSHGTDIVSMQSVEFPVAANNNMQRTESRQLIRVWPVPAIDYGATVIWWREMRPLTEDADEPIIPISSYLIHATAAEGFRQMGRVQEAAVQDQLAERSMYRIRHQYGNKQTLHAAPRFGDVTIQTGVWGWR